MKRWFLFGTGALLLAAGFVGASPKGTNTPASAAFTADAGVVCGEGANLAQATQSLNRELNRWSSDVVLTDGYRIPKPITIQGQPVVTRDDQQASVCVTVTRR